MLLTLALAAAGVVAAVVLAVGLWAGTGGRAAPARAAVLGQQFGANVNRLFEGGVLSPSAVDAQLAALRATGATVARTDALWEASEPQPPVAGVHHYDWRFDDGIAAALARHGLNWLPIIDYSPPWAESVAGVDHSAPADVGDYASYAAAFAARYGPAGAFWRSHPTLRSAPVPTIEIWNEPDNPAFWSPAPDPARYAALYLAARSAIEAVAPSVRVVVGGLQRPERFLPALLAADRTLAGQIDGVSVHLYGSDPGAVLTRARNVRSLLERLGLGGVPLYVTEFGWTTSPAGALHYLPGRLRPAYLAFTLAGLGRLDCGLSAVIAYTWETEQRDPANPEQWYGINPPADGSDADVNAFAAGLRAATAAGAARQPCAGA